MAGDPKAAERSKRKQYIETARKAVLRKKAIFDYAWGRYKHEMDVMRPGWDSDRLFVVKARATLQQEVDAKFHSDLVVVPHFS